MPDNQILTADLPAHVPGELVCEDYPFIMGANTAENPFRTMVPALHDGPDLIYSTNFYPGFQPAWIPRRLETVQALYMDTEHFSSAAFSPYPQLIGEDWSLVPVEIDPPAHATYRALLNPLFTPARLRGLEDRVREAARDTIAKFKDDGECEFMHAFALRFPIIVFLDLMGLPRDRMEQFLEWEFMLLHSLDIEDLAKGARLSVDYLREVIEERRKNPVDDLVSLAVTATADGRKLNDNELIGLCFNLFIGGLDTVSTNIAWQIRHLAEHPEDQRRLRADPSLIPAAIEEMYRRYAAVTTFRTCIKQTVLHGVTIMPGDKIAMPTTLANTDPAAWERPFEVDFNRAPRHITFAYGVHRCVGAPLARRESVIAIEELLAAIPEFSTAEGEALITELGPILQPKNLPLVWGGQRSRRAAAAVEPQPANLPQSGGQRLEGTIAEVTGFLAARLGSMEPFGKVIAMHLDGHELLLDGTANPPKLVTATDQKPDVTVRAALKDFVAILNKEMNPQLAMVKGKLKVRGDITSVMALTKLL
ncbi:cytochrome P450 [Sphingobium fontiphilum]|uniref:Cytochrome P450 n=1 Tax=Sphingobium fontiphilum TaxID=944425 RepID=A0A7W6DPJ8_9SPHN|nr:cytochrome P450 [Sphingobium fontiphilum]MBB3983668.1 cytochrome P450 [Sphingobium fontiphilum]